MNLDFDACGLLGLFFEFDALRQHVERSAVGGSNNSKMIVERRNFLVQMPLSKCDRASIRKTKGQVGILGHELSGSLQVAIIGPSGSGKSTLLNILGCLDIPTSGTYWLNGTDVATLSDAGRAAVRGREIGFVFQQFHLLAHRSVLENVELGTIYGTSLQPLHPARNASTVHSMLSIALDWIIA